MQRKKIMTVFGTRPEAIKMAPVVKMLEQFPEQFESLVCVTAQHRDMLDQVLRLFQITPDVDLNLMQPNQDLFQITTRVLNGMKTVLETHQPDMVLVHGDTTTTMAASLAAFYLRIPVGHVEAGLRTFDKDYPFPEEMNRVVADGVSTLHFAPTERSVNNLIQSGQPRSGIYLTGNTVIDALFYTLENKQADITLPVNLPASARLILVTAHRRENFGTPMQDIARAVLDLANAYPDVHVVFPVHPNPNVREAVYPILEHHERIHLIAPLEYEPFCQLMKASTLILTDSGGVQEEAPSLKKPVLVLRDETERPEAVEMGTVKLVGPHYDAIVMEAKRLLDDPVAYNLMAQRANPYGDGQASRRIVEAIERYFTGDSVSPLSQTSSCSSNSCTTGTSGRLL